MTPISPQVCAVVMCKDQNRNPKQCKKVTWCLPWYNLGGGVEEEQWLGKAKSKRGVEWKHGNMVMDKRGKTEAAVLNRRVRSMNAR